MNEDVVRRVVFERIGDSERWTSRVEWPQDVEGHGGATRLSVKPRDDASQGEPTYDVLVDDDQDVEGHGQTRCC